MSATHPIAYQIIAHDTVGIRSDNTGIAKGTLICNNGSADNWESPANLVFTLKWHNRGDIQVVIERVHQGGNDSIVVEWYLDRTNLTFAQNRIGIVWQKFSGKLDFPLSDAEKGSQFRLDLTIRSLNRPMNQSPKHQIEYTWNTNLYNEVKGGYLF